MSSCFKFICHFIFYRTVYILLRLHVVAVARRKFELAAALKAAKSSEASKAAAFCVTSDARVRPSTTARHGCCGAHHIVYAWCSSNGFDDGHFVIKVRLVLSYKTWSGSFSL